MVRVPRTIPDYDAVFEPIRAARKAKDGNRPATRPAPPRPS
ncbi:hypothetical protein [Streptomyces sp. NEAU-174]